MNHRLSWGVLVALISSSVGCSFVDDFGRFSVGDGSAPDSGTDTMVADSSTDSIADTTPADTRPPLPGCATAYLEPAVPVDDDTRTATDDLAGSCGGSASNDVVYAFVAPDDDYYLFETNGSSFDTVLYLNETCTGDVEVACNNDGATAPQSEIVHAMSAGETVIVIADGNAGDSGDVRITAGPVTCPDVDLTPALLPVETTTVGRPDDHSTPCGGGGAGDRAFRYTATTSGFHRFTLTSETTGYDPMISVERGPICGGEIVQCHPSEDGVAEVTRNLADGEVLTLRVDGSASSDEGDYRLEVTELPAVSCDTTPLDFSGPITGALAVGDAHTHSGSCGEAYHVVSVTPPLSFDNPDIAFLATSIMMPPAPPCSVSCAVSVSADFPFILSVQETDTCNGNELACVGSTLSGTRFNGSVDLVSLEPATGNAIIILERQIQDNDVSGIAVPYGDQYTVNYGCMAIC